jgi:hypothetical protein
VSRRLLIAGGSALALAIAGVVALLALREPGPETIDAGETELAALAGASCPPEYEVLRAGDHSPEAVAAARRGRFAVRGETVRLEPPVDWLLNPIEARSFSHNLWKFQWLDPLLYAYRTEGDVAALERALALVLDFARANPPDGEPVDGNVWDDKRTGDRGPYLAYVMRAAECEGLLDDGERELLLETMGRHLETLTDPALYKPTNHGLFADLALTMLALQLDFLPEAEEWGALGRARFERTLREGTAGEEALWLEHSAGYQILVTRALTRFLEVPGNETPGLVELRRDMQDVVGWLRMPDGKIPQFGDSDLKRVPPFADKRAGNDVGVLELAESGLAVAKRDDGYLSVLASYFSDAHKHADALSFDLFDRDRRVITDTGLFHKDKDENFAFAHATRAHSVLVVDGEEFPRDGSGTYGSGIVQTGKGRGMVAILGTNPAVAEQDVEHERLFLYDPGRFLVVVDRLAAEGEHRYARFLHFDPAIEVRPERVPGPANGLRLRAPGFRGAVRSDGGGDERIELARGERNPLRGMTSPSFRRWVPRWSARLRSEGGSLDHLTTITLDGPPLQARLESWDETGIWIEIRRGRRPIERVHVHEPDGSEGDFRIDVRRNL